eukprot:TRINITY_DN3484_c0_g2_i5.p1 TRINITY_DN3484_c0_g2~~TRINITY_DN3484_c0_g2_i5.p1  ORF type:complete len:1202 (+),score=515.41 TRINITY_DN3484_c0_g2_i5:1290-4895(+)
MPANCSASSMKQRRKKSEELNEAKKAIHDLENDLYVAVDKIEVLSLHADGADADTVNQLREHLREASATIAAKEQEIEELRHQTSSAGVPHKVAGLERLLAEKEDIEDKMEALLKKLSASEAYIAELEMALETARVRKQELDDLRDRLDEAVQIAELEKAKVDAAMAEKLEVKEKMCRDLKAELEESYKQRNKLKEELTVYMARCMAAEGKVIELELEAEGATPEVASLKEKLRSEEDTVRELAQQLADTDGAMKNLIESGNEREAEVTALRQQLKAAKEELGSVRREYSKLNETQLYIDQSPDASRQLKEAQMEIQDLEAEVRESKTEILKLRSQLAGSTGLARGVMSPDKASITNDYENLKLKTRQLEDELLDCNDEIKDLKEQLGATQAALDDCRERAEPYSPKVHDLVKTEMVAKLRDSETKVLMLEEQNTAAARQIDSLISKFQATEDMLNLKQDECQRLEDEVNALRNTEVNQQLDILTNQLMEAEAKMALFQETQDNQATLELVQRLEASERELRNELRRRPHEADVQAQMEVANERVAELEMDLNKASEEKQQLEDEIARLHNHLENSDQLCEEKQTEIDKLYEHHQVLRADYDKLKETAASQQYNEMELQRLHNKIKDQDEYIKVLEEPSDYKSSMGYDAELQEWRVRHKQLEESIAQMRKEVSEAEMKAETSKQTAEDYREIAKEMTGKADYAEDAYRDVTEKLVAAQEENEALHTTIATLRAQASAGQRQPSGSEQSRVKSLESQLRTANDTIAHLRKTIGEFKSRNMFLTIDKNQLIDKFSDAESKVATLKEHANALKQKLTSAKQEVQAKGEEVLTWKKKCEDVSNELSIIHSQGTPTPGRHAHDSLLPLSVWDDTEQLKKRDAELQEMTEAYQQQLRINSNLRNTIEEMKEAQAAGKAAGISDDQKDALKNIASILRSKTLELEADANAINELNDERTRVKQDFMKMEELLKMEKLESREDEELLMSLRHAFEHDTVKLDTKSQELKKSIKQLQEAYGNVLALVRTGGGRDVEKDVENAALKCVVQLVADQLKVKEKKYQKLRDRYNSERESVATGGQPRWGEVLTDVTEVFGKVQDLREILDPYTAPREVEELEEFCGGLVIKYSLGLNDLRERPPTPISRSLSPPRSPHRIHTDFCPVPGRISPRPPTTTPTITTIAASAPHHDPSMPYPHAPPSLTSYLPSRIM